MTRLILLVVLSSLACRDSLPEYETVAASDGYVRLPLESVADGRVHFYSVVSGGKRINFLVRSDAKGGIHAHLDACYSCYQYRRGYVVEGDAIVCRACRYRYSLADAEWDYIGACAPIDVPSSIRDGNLLISTRTLVRAERYF